ncbi:MAG: hypothetical protein EBR82_00735 [Caulobacteraceae bacterium]|nr:hypothetical protein [Caulobacteraceae bacterium]
MFEDADPSKIDSDKFPNKLSAVDRSTAKQLASGGLEDNDKKDDIAGAEKVSLAAAALKASQTTMDFGKFVGMAIQMMGKLGSFSSGAGGDLGAIISSDNHIMDGHHRWAATLMVDPKANVGGLKVQLPGEKLVGVLNVWTVAHGGAGKPSDTDLASLTSDSVAEKFKEMASKGGKFLPSPEEMLSAFKKSGFDSLDAAAAHVKKNWDATSKARAVLGWMPAKVDMPAIEPDQLPQVASDIASGKMDINPPYAADTKGQAKASSSEKGSEASVQKSGFDRGGAVMVERWQRLAGIIKG